MAKNYNDAELEQVENNVVNALLAASSYRTGEDKRRIITVRRNGTPLFSFTIEPLDEDTMNLCRRQNTRKRGRTEELDGARFVAQLIYEATIEDDKNRLWRNKEVWDKLNVATGTDVVQAVLTPGERSYIEGVLVEISGYDDDLEGMVRNL